MIAALRRKFILVMMGLVTAMLAAICAVLILVTQQGLEESSVSVLYRVIGESETPAWSEFGANSGVSLPYFTVVVRPNGGAYVVSSQFYDLQDDYDTISAAVNAAFAQGDELGLLEDYHLRYLCQPAWEGWRMAFVDISYERSTIEKTVRSTVLVGVAAFGVFFLISVFLARWAVRPAARAWEQQRQFVADASHELKTPLTVILSNADLLASEEGADPARRRRWTENIRVGGRQMGELVEQLLLLARSDAGQTGEQSWQEVDLTALVREAGLMFEPVAYEAGKRLTLAGVEENLLLWGDGGKLKRLLDILLDNAVKYAQPGGEITLSLAREGRRAVIAVANQGAPIPKEELEEIFRRFYRGDQARASRGFGLGLAIARSIAREHKGKLWAQSGPQGWNTFFCALPLAGGAVL